MKKLLCVLVCVSVLISVFSVSVFAVFSSGSSLSASSSFTLGSSSFSYVSAPSGFDDSPDFSSLDLPIPSGYSIPSSPTFTGGSNTSHSLDPTKVYLIRMYFTDVYFSGDTFDTTSNSDYISETYDSKVLLVTGAVYVHQSSSSLRVWELTPPPNPIEAFVDGVSDFGKILITGGELSDGTEVDSIWSSIIGFIMDNTICLIPVAAFLLILAFGSIRKWYKG